jgi:hypothetical protein
MTKALFLLVTVSSSIASANPRVAALEPQPDGRPGDTAPIATASTLPSTYVSLGGAIGVGGAVDWLYGGTQVEGGYRLTDTLWVRGRLDRAARIGYGAINQSVTVISPEHPHTDAMLGIETRRCHDDAVCLVAGADAGYRFADDNFEGGFTIVPRVGLDLGGRHLRVRPGVEASASFIRQRVGEPELAGMPALGIGFTTEVAYEW